MASADRACLSSLVEAVGAEIAFRLLLTEAFERAAIPFPQRVVYLQERAPR